MFVICLVTMFSDALFDPRMCHPNTKCLIVQHMISKSNMSSKESVNKVNYIAYIQSVFAQASNLTISTKYDILFKKYCNPKGYFASYIISIIGPEK